jgi:hypothetical protein
VAVVKVQLEVMAALALLVMVEMDLQHLLVARQ